MQISPKCDEYESRMWHRQLQREKEREPNGSDIYEQPNLTSPFFTTPLTGTSFFFFFLLLFSLFFRFHRSEEHLPARAWQHLRFLRQLHTFSYVGLLFFASFRFASVCFGFFLFILFLLLLLLLPQHENFNFNTGACVC